MLKRNGITSFQNTQRLKMKDLPLGALTVEKQAT
jgi:hypothetical protein